MTKMTDIESGLQSLDQHSSALDVTTLLRRKKRPDNGTSTNGSSAGACEQFLRIDNTLSAPPQAFRQLETTKQPNLSAGSPAAAPNEPAMSSYDLALLATTLDALQRTLQNGDHLNVNERQAEAVEAVVAAAMKSPVRPLQPPRSCENPIPRNHDNRTTDPHSSTTAINQQQVPYNYYQWTGTPSQWSASEWQASIEDIIQINGLSLRVWRSYLITLAMADAQTLADRLSNGLACHLIGGVGPAIHHQPPPPPPPPRFAHPPPPPPPPPRCPVPKVRPPPSEGRFKQIARCKATPEYLLYIEAVPLTERKPTDPQTPRIAGTSWREFAAEVRAWKLQLHRKAEAIEAQRAASSAGCTGGEAAT